MKEVVTPGLPVKKDNNAIQKQNNKLASKLWQGNLSDNEKMALWSLTQNYGLDPLQKQVIVLGGNFYLTKGGIRKIAGNDPNPPDGIQTFPATEQERKDYGCIHNDPTEKELYEHLFKGIVFKKNCKEPFIEWGMASFGNVTLHNKDHRLCADMAKTRATNRTLRNAYEIGLTSWEEVEGTSPEFNPEDAATTDDQPPEELDPDLEVTPDLGTTKQLNLIYKLLNSHHFDEDRGNLSPAEDISFDDARKLIDKIKKFLDARKEYEKQSE